MEDTSRETKDGEMHTETERYKNRQAYRHTNIAKNINTDIQRKRKGRREETERKKKERNSVKWKDADTREDMDNRIAIMWLVLVILYTVLFPWGNPILHAIFLY